GYQTAAGSSTAGANLNIGVINADGTIETSTQMTSTDGGGSVRAAVSADGLGMWVATANYVRYVPFGNNALTPSTQVSNYVISPRVVEIQQSSTGISPSTSGQLYITGGAGAQGNGIAAIDGPAEINGPGLPNVAGQQTVILGNGSGTNFPTAAD